MMAILGEDMAAAGVVVAEVEVGAGFISLEDLAVGLSSSKAALVFLLGKHIHCQVRCATGAQARRIYASMERQGPLANVRALEREGRAQGKSGSTWQEASVP